MSTNTQARPEGLPVDTSPIPGFADTWCAQFASAADTFYLERYIVTHFWSSTSTAGRANMTPDRFRCYLVTKDEAGKVQGSIVHKGINELPSGDVLIRVAYSSLNYKDALSATGNPGVTAQVSAHPRHRRGRRRG